MPICFWCKQEVEDGHKASGAPDHVPDWMIDGDFGCEDSPLTGEEGVGSHETEAEVREKRVAYEYLLWKKYYETKNEVDLI